MLLWVSTCAPAATSLRQKGRRQTHPQRDRGSENSFVQVHPYTIFRTGQLVTPFHEAAVEKCRCVIPPSNTTVKESPRMTARLRAQLRTCFDTSGIGTEPRP